MYCHCPHDLRFGYWAFVFLFLRAMKIKKILITFLLLLCIDQLFWKLVWNDDRSILQSISSSLFFSLFWLIPIKTKKQVDEQFLLDAPITLLPNEKLSFGSTANKMLSSEVIGGKLFLSNQRLVFAPHKPNAKNLLLEFNCGDISSVQRHPEFPKAIVVIINDNQAHTFNVDKHSEWMHQLMAVLK